MMVIRSFRIKKAFVVFGTTSAAASQKRPTAWDKSAAASQKRPTAWDKFASGSYVAERSLINKA